MSESRPNRYNIGNKQWFKTLKLLLIKPAGSSSQIQTMSESNRDGKFLKQVVHLTSWWWEMASFHLVRSVLVELQHKTKPKLVSETWKFENYLTPLPRNPRIGKLSCASNTVMWFQKFCDNYIYFINLFYCEQHYTATFQSMLHKINTFIWDVYIIFYFNWSFDWELHY